MSIEERVWRNPLLFVLAVSVFFFYVSPFYYYKSYFRITQSLWNVENNSNYVVYSTGCKIIEMDPFDQSVKKFLKKGKPMKCPQRIAKLFGRKLTIDENFVTTWKTKKMSCCFRSIHRVQQRPEKYSWDADWTVKYSNTCYPISPGEDAFIDDSFIKIECQEKGRKTNKKINVEFHGIPHHPKIHSKETRKKTKYWDKRKGKGLSNPPSILVIGVDSISRMHMMRSLPKTKNFLLQNDFIELKGFNKVGQNTFPNIMAGFGGMEQNNYSRCWTKRSMKFDDCPFIWKNFSDLNYLTAFLEDSPGIAIFNFIKLGFVLPPADYYLRPLTVAMHLHNGWTRNSWRSSCVGGVNPTEFQLKYIADLIEKMGRDYPYFIFSWFTSIGHDDFNALQHADDTFKDFFSTSINNANMNPDNTIIIFMSDHGYRHGDFRETFLGFYEESLPFFFIRLPPSLRESHPDWYTNLKRNRNQLTSPLDLHSTLKQILFKVESSLVESDDAMSNVTDYAFSDPINQQFRTRYSIFEFIPENRTCESAHIPLRYCMCGITPVNAKTPFSSHLGDVIISDINYMLRYVIESSKCATLRFSKFLYIREIRSGETYSNKLLNYKDYIVALETFPGKGHFESRLRIMQNSTTRILGDITRINSYRGQSDCISDYWLKTFCFCLNQKIVKPNHLKANGKKQLKSH